MTKLFSGHDKGCETSTEFLVDPAGTNRAVSTPTPTPFWAVPFKGTFTISANGDNTTVTVPQLNLSSRSRAALPEHRGAPFFRCLLAPPFDQTRHHRDEVPGADERRADPGAGAVVLVVGDAGQDRRSLALALDLDQAGVGGAEKMCFIAWRGRCAQGRRGGGLHPCASWKQLTISRWRAQTRRKSHPAPVRPEGETQH
jgi:hypothetical protein